MATTIATVRGQTQDLYSLHVGARGNANSVGNTGLQVQIQTHVQEVSQPAVAYAFWVGDDLVNGGFIQFGYQIYSPGNYCLYGERIGASTNCLTYYDSFGADDVRWFWQYWPNNNIVDVYFEEGPANSAGQDGSWHTYEIAPNVANGWNFVFDGQIVRSFNNYQVVASKDAASVVAEEVTTSSASGNLGPVEFRNLEYWMDGNWQAVTSLTTLLDCVPLTSTTYEVGANCGIVNPYGVSLNGSNDITVGAGQTQVLDNFLLWGNPTLTLQVPSQVQVSIDGVSQPSGVVQTALPSGTYNVSAPSFVQIDSDTRLRFEYWTDGSKVVSNPIVIVTFSTDETVSAVYATQYKLTIDSSQFSSGSERWYDSGTYGNFSVGTYRLLPLTFLGWYDVGGNLITSSSSGTILMDGPQTVVPEWQVNYPLILIYVLTIVGTATVGVWWRRSRTREKSEDETTQPIAEDPHAALEAGEHPALEDHCTYSHDNLRYGDTVKYGTLFLTDRDEILFVASEGLLKNKFVADHRYHVSDIKNVSVENRRSEKPTLAIDWTKDDGRELTFRYDSLNDPIKWRRNILEARDRAARPAIEPSPIKEKKETETQFCISCGTKLESGSDFCHKCGVKQT